MGVALFEFESVEDTSFYEIKEGGINIHVIPSREYTKLVENPLDFYVIDISMFRLALLKTSIKNKLLNWIRDNCQGIVYMYRHKLYFTDKDDFLLYRLSYDKSNF